MANGWSSRRRTPTSGDALDTAGGIGGATESRTTRDRSATAHQTSSSRLPSRLYLGFHLDQVPLTHPVRDVLAVVALGLGLLAFAPGADARDDLLDGSGAEALHEAAASCSCEWEATPSVRVSQHPRCRST